MEDLRPLNVLLLYGASGSGKTFIKNSICNHNDFVVYRKNQHLYRYDSVAEIIFNDVGQVTTRAKREEENSLDYTFINNEEYEKLKDKLTCKTFFNNNSYGTPLKYLLYGGNVVNVIVVNKEGGDDLINNLHKNINSEINIKKALVLSNPCSEIISKHDRSSEIYEEELIELLSQPYDYYLHNYIENRITIEEALDKMGFDILKLKKSKNNEDDKSIETEEVL